jgi:threonine dehydratase
MGSAAAAAMSEARFPMITIDDILQARPRIQPFVRRTPLERSRTLSRELGANAYLKLELFQRTGSFKPRGAFHQILRLTPDQRARGVVGVSGGNFAQALADAGRTLGAPTMVCMPETAPRASVEATRAYGASIELAATFPEVFARAEAMREAGACLLHPFDDPYQMAGVGTIGLEVHEDLPQVTDIVISIGGGGLITGVAVALEALVPGIRIWGVETEGADAMGQALKAGRVVQVTPTSLARTLSAPYVAEDALTIMQRHQDRHVLVSDREAYEAARHLLERSKINAELAASCTLAAARTVREAFSPDSHVVLLICGGNVSIDDWLDYHRRFA